VTPAIDRRSIADKAPRPERHAAVVVVGAGVAGVAAAIEAARSGVDVLLVDENPIDNDMMALDVPLYFGQRMQPSVRNRVTTPTPPPRTRRSRPWRIFPGARIS
jgi:NADPH-dependent 2,4-dienoyl-CoA reductase/sulfur reductase-like enzyme